MFFFKFTWFFCSKIKSNKISFSMCSSFLSRNQILLCYQHSYIHWNISHYYNTQFVQKFKLVVRFTYISLLTSISVLLLRKIPFETVTHKQLSRNYLHLSWAFASPDQLVMFIFKPNKTKQKWRMICFSNYRLIGIDSRNLAEKMFLHLSGLTIICWKI